MNNFYFYSKQLIKVFNNNRELVDLIFSINELRSNYIINPQAIIDVGGNINNRANGMAKLQSEIKQKNVKILSAIRSVRPNKVYDLINEFLSDLNLFDTSYNDENELVKLLKDFPDKHTDAYSEKESKYIFSLVENTSRIHQAIIQARDRALYIIEKVDSDRKNTPIDYLPLRIGTDQDIPLADDFIKIFKGLENIYNFICYLYKVDENTKPLIINKFNTGSWYSEILGIKQVIISLENLLTGIGKFIRDYITGKINKEKFENECSKAEAFIHLLKVAKENGIDNAQLGIFKELNPLIESFKNDTTTIIEINDEEILKLRKLDKLTLLDKRRKRDDLLEKINLSIEEGKKKKTTTPKKKEE